jgi:hypothetical protein
MKVFHILERKVYIEGKREKMYIIFIIYIYTHTIAIKINHKKLAM